jgi:hypothetical protein
MKSMMTFFAFGVVIGLFGLIGLAWLCCARREVKATDPIELPSP